MRSILAILALAALVTGSASVQAACSFSTPNAGVTAIAGLYYLDDRGAGNIFLYEESNFIGGLQRGSCSNITSECDSCITDPAITADRLIL